MSMLKCPECERQWAEFTRICPHCGLPLVTNTVPAARIPRWGYALTAVFLGCLGVHNFVIGRLGRGALQLAVTLAGGYLVRLVPLVVFVWAVLDIATVKVDGHGRRLV